MALGATLSSLIDRVKEEIGSSLNPALGQNFRDGIKGRIRLEYERLYQDFDWPHLETWQDKPVAAGQRYYDLPTVLSLETVQQVFVRWGSIWQPLSRGFSPGQYNSGDSDNNYRYDPIQCWRPYGDGQIEVWPLPASASTLRFVGKRAFTPLTADTDQADLDDRLISLFAAGKFLKRRKADDADLVLAEAAAHYKTLRGRSQAGEARYNLARVNDEYDPTKRSDRYLYAPLTGGGGTSRNPSQIAIYAAGVPSSAEVLLVYNAAEVLTLVAADSIATAETAATASAVLQITRNAVQIGTITFGAGQTTGVVAFTATGISVDDVLRIVAPASPDATLAGISITLVGS